MMLCDKSRQFFFKFPFLRQTLNFHACKQQHQGMMAKKKKKKKKYHSNTTNL